MTASKVELQQIQRSIVVLAEKIRLHSEKAASEFAKMERRIFANEQQQQQQHEHCCQMCERRLSQVKSIIQEHQEKLEEVDVDQASLEQNYSRTDDLSAQHGDTLDEFRIRHEENQQPARAVKQICEQRLSRLESNFRRHQENFEEVQLGFKFCLKDLSVIQKTMQENRWRLDDLTVRHEEHQQHAKDFNELCEWRLSQLESDIQKHQKKLEQQVSDVGHRRQEDRDRPDELGKCHEEHQLHAKATQEICKQLSQVESYIRRFQENFEEVELDLDFFRKHLSVFQNTMQENRSRLEALTIRHEEQSNRLEELVKRHDEHQQQAKYFTKMCRRRLSQLEIGKQEHHAKLDEVGVDKASFLEQLSWRIDDLITQRSDRHDEFGKRHEEHQQYATDFNKLCEWRLCQLEMGKQEHLEKLQEVGQTSSQERPLVLENSLRENRLHNHVNIQDEIHKEAAASADMQCYEVVHDRIAVREVPTFEGNICEAARKGTKLVGTTFRIGESEWLQLNIKRCGELALPEDIQVAWALIDGSPLGLPVLLKETQLCQS